MITEIIEVKISDLGDIVTGNTPPTSDRSLYDGRYPLIMPTDIIEGDKVIHYTAETVSEKGFKKYKNALIPANMPCVVTIGSIGKKLCLTKVPSFTNQAINAIIVNTEKYDPDFVFYLMKYNLPQVKNLSSGTASGRENVSKTSFGRIKVKLPKYLPTQKKIASVLSAYDDLIENNNQRIQLLEDMAEEIYKEWFVRFRFPGYQDNNFVDKEGKQVPHGTKGAIPEGWETWRVSDYGNVITGKTPSKNDDSNFEGNIPFIKTPDMGQGMFFTKTEESLSNKGANSQKNQFVPENSICVSCIGTVGKLAITTTLSQTNQQINSVIPKKSYFLGYLYFSFLRLKPVIESYAATGATMANLSKGKFENLKLLKPTNKLIEDYSKVVSSFFEEIRILLQKNQILQETRDLLLPRLISGKLSVDNIPLPEEELQMAAEPSENYK